MKERMTSDRFALAAFSLAFCIKRLLESDSISQKAKDTLQEDLIRLQGKVTALARIMEHREAAAKLRERSKEYGLAGSAA